MFCFRLFLGTFIIIAGCLSASATPLVTKSLASAESNEGQCRAVLTVSPERPYLADTITLTLTVTCPDDVSVEFPPFGEMLGELRIVDIKTTNQQLILTTIPRRAGKTPIWAMTIRCGQERIDLPAIELEIATEIDSENASLDSIGLVAEPIPKPTWHIYAIVAGLVLAAVILFWLIYNRRKIDEPVEITPLSAQEMALRRLADLLESRRHESDVKGFFVELSDIVRWYVERLTGIRAPELTTEEFLHRIAEPTYFAGTQAHTLIPFLESADFVKFAKHIPTSDEMMLAFRRAETFVRGEIEFIK
jgi:hypothetical protein